MCLLAAFVSHRPNKYFHVTASNGIVSNSPYTPLAIMTASPIASVKVFDPRCRCRLATFAALPTPSMIEPIIMLTDHPPLAPHRQVRRCHRSIHCWHGHAARRSALPRERFSLVVESECGAVAVGRTYLLPPLSFGGALLVRPWLRFHIPLIEPDMQISRIRLSDKTSRLHPRHVAQAGLGVRARSARRGAGVDRSRPCVA